MSDSEDFGDVDDNDFIQLATQVELATTSFLPSSRPTKRRRIDQHTERNQSIPATNAQKSITQQTVIANNESENRRPLTSRRNRNVTQVDDDSDEEAFDQAPFAASLTHKKIRKATVEATLDHAPLPSAFTPKRRKISKAGQSSTDLDLGQSTSATSVSTSGKRKRGRPRKGKENCIPGRESASPSKKSEKKQKHRVHVPSKTLDLRDVFCTQPPPLDSSPGKLRGPIWKRPAQSPGDDRNVGRRKSSTLVQALQTHDDDEGFAQAREGGLRKAIVHDASPKLPTPNKDVLAFDAAQELADLPSDAFASSSSSPQEQIDEVIFISSQASPRTRGRLVAPQAGLRQMTLFGRGAGEAVPASQVNKRYNFVSSQKQEPPTHHKLDEEAMKTWVYPTNLGTIRDYQFNIVARGLFHNLLVALPTGLGKTFIAATIMLNWFRWTKDAQIVFVAPTKPLVSQQVEACFGIAGIPRSYTSMLTGSVAPGIRAEEWADKRVFFMTPQTVINDLKTGICDPKRIVLIVVDEAHRATGGYAYVEVVKFIRRFNESFRVLALTATPGSDVESVQKVIDGLDISRVEIRMENSLDIRGYVHRRKIEKHVFENSEEMEMCMGLYAKAVQPVLSKLNAMNAYWSKDPLSLTPYKCTITRQQWFASDAGRKASFPVKSMVNSIFTVLASLSHGMELLKYHGMGPFYAKLREFKESNEESKSKYKREICDSEHFSKLMVRLHTWVNNDNFIGHPKLDFLQEVILDHFVNASEGRRPDGAPPSETRIMVFAHFRDSAEEIVRILKRHQPMIRPHVFVGQASAKNSDGMDQRTQQEVIDKFKKGVFNTLVATSIGEEGLDIGEVDLIICYDSKASPIRMLQRMGRTGRKREGKIILLQMKGKEEDDATKAKDNYEKMQEMIANGSRFQFHEDRSRRIIPKDVQPVVDKRAVEIPPENSQLELPEPRRRGGRAPKRPPKKFHMPDNVITGFVQVSRMGDPDGGVQAARPRARKKAPAIPPGEEPIVLDPLETVLLNAEESKDLERRYQTVFDDDESPMIEALNLGAHPHRQRIISKTDQFRRPGRVSVTMVKMLRRMHAVDGDRLETFKRSVHHSDLEEDGANNIVVSDFSGPESEDEAPPRPKPAPKSKPISKTKTPRKLTTIAIPDFSDTGTEGEALPSPSEQVPKSRPTPKIKAVQPRSRSAATKAGKAGTTPARRPKARPKARSQSLRISDLVEEGASSSPPPTDPRMRIASQAVSLGSDDTSGSERQDDNDDPRLDSDLRSFIADDEEEVQIFSSSLPATSSFGRERRGQVKARELFTSDGVDDMPDFVVSSESRTLSGDEIEPVGRSGANRRGPLVVDSDEDEIEDEEEEAVARPRKRVRRVIDDDEDENE